MSVNPTSNPPVPTFDKMLWPTLQALQALGGSGTIQEIEAKVIEIMALTEAQMSVLHKGGPQSEVSYRLAWARTYLKKAGAIDNSSRGVWTITDKGRKLREPDVARIPSDVRRATSRAGRTAQSEPRAAGQISGVTYEVADEAWRSQLLETLHSIRPDAFERLCQRLLRESGFTHVEVTGRSGDGGIDGIGVLRISLVSFHVLFQCKRVRGSIGSSVVRDLRGAMAGRTDKGIIITTGTFTAEARREATRDGAPPIELIDGEALCDALRQYNLGVRTEVRRVEYVQVDTAWFDAL